MIFAKQYNYAIVAGLAASLTVAGCDKLTPNGRSNTLSLLRTGSEQVCAASDVQDSLRKILLPKPDDLTNDATAEDKQAAIAAVRLSFDLTTLQSFDKSVSRATCETTLRLAGQQGAAEKVSVEYQVSPSADDPSGLVVGTRDTEAGSAATTAVKAALEKRLQQRQADQDATRDRGAKAKLLAIVTPKWLVGSWIRIEEDASSCAADHALTFMANHVAVAQGKSERWLLDQDELRVFDSGPGRVVNDVSTITEADPVSFTVADGEGGSVVWRRCARNEMLRDTRSTFGIGTMPDNTASPN